MGCHQLKRNSEIMARRFKQAFSCLILGIAVGCSALATPSGALEGSNTASTEFGPQPQIPKPEKSLIPTINIAPAVGWAAQEKPTPAAGLSVSAYANELNHPRWLYVLPNGDVLVAESNAPAKHDEKSGIKGLVMKGVMKVAGANTESADRITLLRGLDASGRAIQRSVFLQNIRSPFGMALIGNDFYVAATDAIWRFPYQTGDTVLRSPGVKVIDLPAGPINHHWTKNIIASPDGKYLYVTVGSNSNAGEHGIEQEKNRAAIHQLDLTTGKMRIFASGLRNPNGLAWEPYTGRLWTTVNERDELGNELVPDYMTSVKPQGFYGWPYSYFGQHVDERVKPQRPDLVARALVPDYALGAHTASLGLLFYSGDELPSVYQGAAVVAQHGSWNRKPRSGYKVVAITFKQGQPVGLPQDLLTGFLDAEGKARGRPVGLATGKDGALLVADDVGNVIWRLQRASVPSQ